MSKLQHRSEQRLHRRIEKASIRREGLLQDDKLSLPSGAGKLAIIVSSTPDYGAARLTSKEQHQAFLAEAEELQETRKPLHQDVAIRPIAVMQDIKLDFADPEVTDIILIGHGCINALWAENGKYFDWEIASNAATFLKQGRIEQRMCGNLPSNKLQLNEGHVAEELPHKYSVPLGTFAVSKLTNVIAAPGIVVPNINPKEDLFIPVFHSDTNASQQIINFNADFGSVASVIV